MDFLLPWFFGRIKSPQLFLRLVCILCSNCTFSWQDYIRMSSSPCSSYIWTCTWGWKLKRVVKKKSCKKKTRTSVDVGIIWLVKLAIYVLLNRIKLGKVVLFNCIVQLRCDANGCDIMLWKFCKLHWAAWFDFIAWIGLWVVLSWFQMHW